MAYLWDTQACLPRGAREVLYRQRYRTPKRSGAVRFGLHNEVMARRPIIHNKEPRAARANTPHGRLFGAVCKCSWARFFQRVARSNDNQHANNKDQPQEARSVQA